MSDNPRSFERGERVEILEGENQGQCGTVESASQTDNGWTIYAIRLDDDGEARVVTKYLRPVS